MATATDKIREAQAIHVSDMPPLHVTTTGIPSHEHLETPPPERGGERAAQRRSDRVTWTVAGLVVLMFLVASAALRVVAPASIHMGLSSWAWSQYRSGERVATSPVAVVPVAPNSPFTGPPMTAISPLGPTQPPYIG